MDMNGAKIKSLEDIIALMDGHMAKGYGDRLPKKAGMKIETTMEAEPTSESPAEVFEAKEPAEADMDDPALQELMKMYEDEEGSDEPADVNGLY